MLLIYVMKSCKVNKKYEQKDIEIGKSITISLKIILQIKTFWKERVKNCFKIRKVGTKNNYNHKWSCLVKERDHILNKELKTERIRIS